MAARKLQSELLALPPPPRLTSELDTTATPPTAMRTLRESWVEAQKDGQKLSKGREELDEERKDTTDEGHFEGANDVSLLAAEIDKTLKKVSEGVRSSSRFSRVS